MATLWQLTRDYEKLRAKLADLGGELDEETEQQLDELHGTIEDKVRRIARIREAINEDLVVATEWARRTAEHKAKLATELARIERYMTHHLAKLGMEIKLEATDTTPPVTYSAKQGRGRTVVPVDAYEKLPPACLVPQDPKPDLIMIRTMIDNGIPMPQGVKIVKDWKLVVK